MFAPIFVHPSLYGYNPPTPYTFTPHAGHNAQGYMARQRMQQYGSGHPDRLRYTGMQGRPSLEAEGIRLSRANAVAQALAARPHPQVQQRGAPLADASDFNRAPRSQRLPGPSRRAAGAEQLLLSQLPGLAQTLTRQGLPQAQAPTADRAVLLQLLQQFLAQRAGQQAQPAMGGGSRYLPRQRSQRAPTTINPRVR